MHNKVVYQAAKSLDAVGIPVLRFNFRGTGLSAGEHDRGQGEMEDVRAALDFLSHKYPLLPLAICGFSFGCWVGLRVGCGDDRVIELIGLGTPVNTTDFSFLLQCVKPKLFVHGAEDQYGDLIRVETLVRSIPGENELIVVAQADHFFAGRLSDLDVALRAWISERHPELRQA